MNADQQNNIDTMVKNISETLTSTWSYFHLLEGFHKGSKAHPIAIKKFDSLFDQIWRAVFDGLFAKIGTLIDKKKHTYSLHNLITMTKRYDGSELQLVAKSVEKRLIDPDGPIAKIKSWRHQVVAHQTQNARTEDFYKNNKMNLDELANGLKELETLLNTISVEVLAVNNDTENGSNYLIQQGADLFACIAGQQTKGGPTCYQIRDTL